MPRGLTLQQHLDAECVRVISITCYDAIRSLDYKDNGRYKKEIAAAKDAISRLTAAALKRQLRPGTSKLATVQRATRQ